MTQNRVRIVDVAETLGLSRRTINHNKSSIPSSSILLWKAVFVKATKKSIVFGLQS